MTPEHVKYEKTKDGMNIRPVGEEYMADLRIELDTNYPNSPRLKEGDARICLTRVKLRWLRDHGINAALEAMDGKPATKPPLGSPVGEISQEHAREMYRWCKEVVCRNGPTSPHRPLDVVIAEIESSWPQPWVDMNGNVAEVGMMFSDKTDAYTRARHEIEDITKGGLMIYGIKFKDSIERFTREYFHNHCTLFRIVPVEGER